MSETSDFEADLLSLQQFRDWLASLVEAQQPQEEWSLSLEQLKQRWEPQHARDGASCSQPHVLLMGEAVRAQLLIG